MLPPIGVSSSPTTCVAKGLAIETTQRLANDQPVMLFVTSKAGYGVLLRDDKISKRSATDVKKQQASTTDRNLFGMRVKWMIYPVSILHIFS